MGGINTRASKQPRVQPGIHHLMAWTLGCALGFAAYRGLSPPWAMPAKVRFLSFAYNLSMGVALGTILTGAGVLAHRRLRGEMSYPGMPGHWLLMFGLASALANALAVIVFRSLLAAWFPPGTSLTPYWLAYRMARNGPDLAGMYSQCVGWGTGAVVTLAFCWYLRSRIRWPWFAVFLLFLLAGATLSTGSIYVTVLSYGPSRWGPAQIWYRNAPHLYAGLIILAVLAIVLAIAQDFRVRVPSDGLHWAGVAAWLTVAAMQLILYFEIMP